MGKVGFAASHTFYMLWMLLYFIGWIIALAGVAASQHSCASKENEFYRVAGGSGLFSPTVGGNCSRLFRFAWFVICLGVIPLIAEALALTHRAVKSGSRSHLGRGAPFWAVIAVLYILLANAFYNALDSGKGAFTATAVPPPLGTGISHKSASRLRCALAGFAISAAAALMLLLLAPYCDEAANSGRDDTQSTTTTQSKKNERTEIRGGVVPPVAPVDVQAAGTGHPPQVVVA